MKEYKEFNDFIIVMRVKWKEGRHHNKRETIKVKEDCIRSKNSAELIVNHLINRFNLKY